MGALEGRRAVVIGGSSGFGEQIAERLAAEGARLVLAARNLERLEPVAQRLGAAAVACDITRYDDVKQLAASATDRLGGLDVAINSAGYEDMVPFESLSPERVEPMVAVQFVGGVYFIRHMANAMGKGGSLVTVSSLTASLVPENYAAYAGSKAGINHVSRIAAAEYGPLGIRVNTVAPSVIETPLTAHLVQVPAVRDALLEQTPLGRLGDVDDVTRAVLWIASDEARYITGQNLVVDGGTSLRKLPTNADVVRHLGG